jgi:hypothetical protein
MSYREKESATDLQAVGNRGKGLFDTIGSAVHAASPTGRVLNSQGVKKLSKKGFEQVAFHEGRASALSLIATLLIGFRVELLGLQFFVNALHEPGHSSQISSYLVQ